jgi:hypothetical protein
MTNIPGPRRTRSSAPQCPLRARGAYQPDYRGHGILIIGGGQDGLGAREAPGYFAHPLPAAGFFLASGVHLSYISSKNPADPAG